MEIDVKFPIKQRTTAGALVHRKNLDGQVEVLCIERTFEGGKTDVTFPKGGIDNGEYLQQTAIREVLEETGYKIKLEKYLGSFEFQLFSNKDNEYYFGRTYFFLASLEESEPTEQTNPENTSAVSWLKLEEAMEMISFQVFKDILESAKKYF